jgi:tRNA(fMet)-specific endonuclease VapC
MNLPDRIILDTSILINYLRRKPGFEILRTVRELYLPAMVLAEIQVGWMRLAVPPEAQKQRFEDLASAMFFLPIQRNTVALYIEIRRHLESLNAIIPENDLWIAATAREHELPLLTSDAHFRRVPNLSVADPPEIEPPSARLP